MKLDIFEMVVWVVGIVCIAGVICFGCHQVTQSEIYSKKIQIENKKIELKKLEVFDSKRLINELSRDR